MKSSFLVSKGDFTIIKRNNVKIMPYFQINEKVTEGKNYVVIHGFSHYTITPESGSLKVISYTVFLLLFNYMISIKYLPNAKHIVIAGSRNIPMVSD